MKGGSNRKLRTHLSGKDASLRVLQVPAFAPPHEGGSERFCFNLSKRLLELGHKPTIYTSKIPSWTPIYEKREGIPIIRFRVWVYFLYINPMSFFMQAVNHNLDKFDLVHVHSYVFFFANQIALLRKMRNFPYILHLHGGLEPISANLMGIKASALKIFYDKFIGPTTIQAADRVISCCETDRQRAIKTFGADPDKVVTIPNCIDSTKFREATPQNPINVTYIGRLTELKGSHQLPYIVKAICRRHRNVRFTIVGGGVLEEPLRQALKNYPVTFLGRVPNEAVPDILAESSVLILPSFLEGFPLVTLEAHASAVPVVCYDVGGCWEAVKTGETGALVPVGDAKRFVEALSWVIEDREARQNMGKIAKKRLLERYDWPVAVKKILEVYHNTVSAF